MPPIKKFRRSSQFPTAVFKVSRDDVVMTGDLHANFQGTLDLLMQIGVLEMQPKVYARLKQIYYMPIRDVTKQIREEFWSLMQRITVNPLDLLVSGGDNFFDRGRGDLWMVYLFAILQLHNNLVKTPVSNHDAYLLMEFERDNFTFSKVMNTITQQSSWQSIKILIKNQVITEEEVRQLIRRFVIPTIIIAGVFIDINSSLTPMASFIYHAPRGLETDRALALAWGIPYKIGSAEELLETYAELNATLQALLQLKRFTEVFHRGLKYIAKGGEIPVRHPLPRMAWNRFPELTAQKQELGIELPAWLNHGAERLKTQYFHGHTATRVMHEQLISLDTDYAFPESTLEVANSYRLIIINAFPTDMELQCLYLKLDAEHRRVHVQFVAAHPSGEWRRVAKQFTASQDLINDFNLRKALRAKVAASPSDAALQQQFQEVGYRLTKKVRKEFYLYHPTFEWEHEVGQVAIVKRIKPTKHTKQLHAIAKGLSEQLLQGIVTPPLRVGSPATTASSLDSESSPRSPTLRIVETAHW